MHRIHAFALSALFLTLVSLAPAQQPAAAASGKKWGLEDSLPLDPNIRRGKLENGLTYYVRKNTEPKNRAELRLVINAGAVLEDDDQRGLAHFLEHMLFNGTKHFEKQALVDFLESIGLRFGPDLNAYTSFDETVYMLKVPTDSEATIDKSFMVLRDWAGDATLSEEEINKERGVVIEEWRNGQGAQRRILDKLIPAVFAGSKYKDRLPIGDPEIIRNCPPEAIRRFYHDWYRPDLMAVVAVGDIDVDKIETLIKSRFADLKNPTTERAREEFKLAGNKDTIYSIITDKEVPITQVQAYFKQIQEEESEHVKDYRRSLVRGLFEGIINARLAEIAQDPKAPYLGGGIGAQNMVRAGQTMAAVTVPKEGETLPSLELLMTEIARVRQFGFTASELERAKADTLRSYERMYEERNKSNSEGFASEYIRNFLEKEPAPGIPVEYALANQFIPTISLDEVNAIANKYITKDNRVVVVVMPDKEGLTPPTEKQLASVLDKVEATDLKAYEDKTVDEPLVSKTLEPVPVKSTKKLEALGATEVTLANGVKVVLKPTDFKAEQVLFSAFSPGGTSLVDDKKYFDAVAADTVVDMSGVGNFDPIALSKKLAGKTVSINPSISELSEGLSGSASTKDVETLLQLAYLYFTAPRADESALSVYKQQRSAMLQNFLSTPQGVFQKTAVEAMYGNNLRRRIPSVEEIQSTNLADTAAFYKERFADADDFTFVFVGNFDEPALIALCQRYLGNLPVKEGSEKWKNVDPGLPDGVIKSIAKKGTDPQSSVSLTFHGPFVYNRENRFTIRMMAEVLNIKLREELREDRGGVYGVRVGASPSDRPEPRYTLRIAFNCDPARVQELKDAVMEQITWIQNAEEMTKYLEKVKEQEKRSFEQSVRNNGFWLSTIQFYYEHPEEDPKQLLKLPETVDAINAPEIREAAKTYLNTKELIDVTLYPENFEVPKAN